MTTAPSCSTRLIWLRSPAAIPCRCTPTSWNGFGANRAGPWGSLQSLADGTKLFFKESFTPERSDRRVYRLAPYLSMVPAFLAFAIVPVGGSFELFHHKTTMQLADPPIGILF